MPLRAGRERCVVFQLVFEGSEPGVRAKIEPHETS